MLEHVINPSSDEALKFIETQYKSIADKAILMIIGDSIIDYRGRARSFLDWGERIIMIKEDGTVLVHQPVMREPVNWQPTGSKTEFKINKQKQFVMRSRHNRPPEKMKVVFRSIFFEKISYIVSINY